jgi:hypothetical protein
MANMNSVKEELTTLIDRLPADASIEDVQYQLYLIEKVRNGLESIKQDGGLTQRQVEERLSKWLT